VDASIGVKMRLSDRFLGEMNKERVTRDPMMNERMV